MEALYAFVYHTCNAGYMHDKGWKYDLGREFIMLIDVMSDFMASSAALSPAAHHPPQSPSPTLASIHGGGGAYASGLATTRRWWARAWWSGSNFLRSRWPKRASPAAPPA